VAPRRVTTLEHLPEWKEHVERVARQRSIPVNIADAPLVDYGGFHWYSLPHGLVRDYELVICDGPPGATIGGRYGLVPAARHLLSCSAVILMDDVERPEEQAVLERWKRESGAICAEHAAPNGRYAEVRLTGERADPGTFPASRSQRPRKAIV
jgi:hypothetical protein